MSPPTDLVIIDHFDERRQRQPPRPSSTLLPETALAFTWLIVVRFADDIAVPRIKKALFPGPF